MRVTYTAVRVAHNFELVIQTKQAAGIYEGRGLPRHLLGHIYGQMDLEY